MKIPETDDFVVDLRKKEPSKPSFSAKSADSEDKQLNKRSNSNYWSFIKYNNAFLVVLVIGVMLFSSLAFASEEVRENTIGAKQVYAEGVDNTLLLETDLAVFNMDFTITGIIEDDESYLITYSYIDLVLEAGAWQMQEKQGGRKISKPFRRDLGLYLADQLSQEAKARLKELKKIKQQELTKGETKIMQITKYSGLIGKVLDISANTFPNYEPIKKIKLKTPTVAENISRRASSASDNMTDVYNEWVDEHPEQVADLNADVIPTEVEPDLEPESGIMNQELGDEEEVIDESAQADPSDEHGASGGADKDIIEEEVASEITEESAQASGGADKDE